MPTVSSSRLPAAVRAWRAIRGPLAALAPLVLGLSWLWRWDMDALSSSPAWFASGSLPKTRLVVFLVDSLDRRDVEAGRFPQLNQRIAGGALHGPVRACAAATTVPCLRAMITGVDHGGPFVALRNFVGQQRLGSSSVLGALAKQGLRIGYFGEAQVAELLQDLTVSTAFDDDAQVAQAASAALDDQQLDLLLLHLSELDQAAHKHTEHSAAYPQVAAQSDARIARVAAQLKPTDHWVVLGDHGHAVSGRHIGQTGSDSYAAYFGPRFPAAQRFMAMTDHAALWAKPFGLHRSASPQDRATLSSPSMPAGGRLAPSELPPFRMAWLLWGAGVALAPFLVRRPSGPWLGSLRAAPDRRQLLPAVAALGLVLLPPASSGSALLAPAGVGDELGLAGLLSLAGAALLVVRPRSVLLAAVLGIALALLQPSIDARWFKLPCALALPLTLAALIHRKLTPLAFLVVPSATWFFVQGDLALLAPILFTWLFWLLASRLLLRAKEGVRALALFVLCALSLWSVMGGRMAGVDFDFYFRWLPSSADATSELVPQALFTCAKCLLPCAFGMLLAQETPAFALPAFVGAERWATLRSAVCLLYVLLLSYVPERRDVLAVADAEEAALFWLLTLSVVGLVSIGARMKRGCAAQHEEAAASATRDRSAARAPA